MLFPEDEFYCFYPIPALVTLYFSNGNTVALSRSWLLLRAGLNASIRNIVGNNISLPVKFAQINFDGMLQSKKKNEASSLHTLCAKKGWQKCRAYLKD